MCLSLSSIGHHQKIPRNTALYKKPLINGPDKLSVTTMNFMDDVAWVKHMSGKAAAVRYLEVQSLAYIHCNRCMVLNKNGPVNDL